MSDTRTLDIETDWGKPAFDELSSTASQLKENASGIVDRAKGKVQELGGKVHEWGDTAAAKINERRHTAAGALESTAGKMHHAADAGAQKISSAVHSAAEGVQSTATYLREHDTRQMLSDIEDVVRKRPGQSLLMAAAVGFLVGRAFRHD
ncbi:MAG TPA: hypothetical protein VIY49_01065 [Bryobacteraceae bacterium]